MTEWVPGGVRGVDIVGKTDALALMPGRSVRMVVVDRHLAGVAGDADRQSPTWVVGAEQEPACAIGADIRRTAGRRCISQMGQRPIGAVDCETRDRIRLGAQRDEQEARSGLTAIGIALPVTDTSCTLLNSPLNDMR